MTATDSGHHETARDWSRAYWALACNQLLVIAFLTLFAAQTVQNSRDACVPRHIDLPTISITVMSTLGPWGVRAIAVLCGLGIVVMALFRKRLISVIAASVIFLGAMAFLIYALIAAYIPLLHFVHSWHP